MGKAFKGKGRNREARQKSGPTSGRPLNLAELDALRDSKILPVVRNLSSAFSKERAEAVAVVNNLLQDANCRRLLLKERVMQKLMEEMLNDSSQEVVVHGWGALRIIAAEEGYDQSINMFRKDVLTPAATAVTKITAALDSLAANAAALDTNSKKLLWLYSENVVGLITSLSETTQDVVDAINKLDLIPCLMGLLSPKVNAPENVQKTVAQSLHSLTDENEEFVNAVITNGDFLSLLMKLRDEPDPAVCVKTVSICGALHNISLALKSTDSPLSKKISDAAILPILTSFLSSSPPISNEDDRFCAAQTALEILASIATAVQGDIDGEFSLDVDGDDAMDDADDAPVGELEESVQEDLDLVTGVGSSPSVTISASAEAIMVYLITNTALTIIPIARFGTTAPLLLQLRTLSVLNNIAWTADATVPADTTLWHSWEKVANDIWSTIITPTITANTADIDLADSIAGLSWAIAKSLKGQLPVSDSQHRAFISLYHAATTDDLKTKCVGVLGCLGLSQGRVELNQEVGVFLVTLIAGSPETPADPTVEALNAVFDVYADKTYDYDNDVFDRNGFLGHLEKALPGVRTMVRRVDKRKYPDLRLRAEEAAMNLQRFIQYKKKERA
ncbi:hypothetical protein RUND412_008104 [Rhizina undulata]